MIAPRLDPVSSVALAVKKRNLVFPNDLAIFAVVFADCAVLLVTDQIVAPGKAAH